jgi:hypothetical protein
MQVSNKFVNYCVINVNPVSYAPFLVRNNGYLPDEPGINKPCML